MPDPARMRTSELLSDPYLSSIELSEHDREFGVRAHSSPTRAPEYDRLLPPEAAFDDVDADINTMWFVGHPEIGELSGYATGAHAEGYGTAAHRQYSHAEGVGTVAAGKYAHAEGVETVAGYAAHSDGWQTSAVGGISFASGKCTLAAGDVSYAAGVSACADDKCSYAWNGASTEQYRSNGAGTFNVNPAGGARGFFVGKTSLNDLLDERVHGGDVGALALRVAAVERSVGSAAAVKLPESETRVSAGIFVGYPNGRNWPWENSQCTDFIKAQPGDVFVFDALIASNIAGYALYDVDKQYLSSVNYDNYNYDPEQYWYSRRLSSGALDDYEVEIPDGAAYVRFSSYISAAGGSGESIDMNVRKVVVECEDVIGRVVKIEAALDGLEECLDGMIN